MELERRLRNGESNEKSNLNCLLIVFIHVFKKKKKKKHWIIVMKFIEKKDYTVTP